MSLLKCLYKHFLSPILSDLSSSDMSGLPADLRWISDLWRKLSDCDSKHRLNYLLNVWNTLLIFRQLQTDIENLAANSWSALSRRVHQGLFRLWFICKYVLHCVVYQEELSTAVLNRRLVHRHRTLTCNTLQMIYDYYYFYFMSHNCNMLESFHSNLIGSILIL